jgi:hypothetical protein
MDLPVWKVRYQGKPLKESEPGRAQRRFHVEVWLEAEDTYLDGEPHVTPSLERFTFLVVPESELLARIAEEQETRYQELKKAFKPLPENQERLTQISFDLSGNPKDATLTAVLSRLETLEEVLKNAEGDTKAVYQAYVRIVKEMRANQVSTVELGKVYNNITKPLRDVDGRHFPNARSAVAAMRRALDDQERPVADRVSAAYQKAGEAKREMAELIAKLNSVLAAMENLGSDAELAREAEELLKAEDDEGAKYKRLRDIVLRALLGDK